MCAILPAYGLLIDQFQKGFVHQRRRLKRVVAALTLHVAGCQASQFRVDSWQQPVKGILMPLAPLLKKLRDLGT
jgi:hypothetical protein